MSGENKNKIIGPQLCLAAQIWSDLQKQTIPADRHLSRYFFQNRKKIGSRDRRFLSETIFSAFRHKSFLEAWVNELEKKRGRMSEQKRGETLCLFAAVKEGLADQKTFGAFSDGGADVYKALLAHACPEARESGSPNEKLALLYSFPLWLVERWVARYGSDEVENLLKYFLARPRLTLRINTLRTRREKVLAWFHKAGVEAFPTQKSAVGLSLQTRKNVLDTDVFRDGWFEPQDEGSQLVCLKMEARAGENVWDVCAGGGGKSLMLAAMMENRGRIVATDLRTYKLDELKKRAKRAGAFNIFPAELARMDELAIAQKGFDKILVDAPCSGTGTFARNPDAKWRINESWFTNLHSEQIGIIEKALPYLKKNGKLYYVTCSLEPAENEGVLEAILKNHPGLCCIPSGEQGEKFFRLWPPKSGTDGFFLAILQKVQD